MSTMEDLAKELKKATDEVKGFAEKTTTELKNLGKTTDETKVEADKAIASMVDLKARLDEIEQKNARRGPHAPEEIKSLGQAFVEREEFKSFLGTPRRGTVHGTFETKAISNLSSGTTLWGAGTSASNSLITPDRQGMVLLPDRRLIVRDLITPGTTTSNNIEFPLETSFQNSAAPVAEAALKPQSDIAFDLKNSAVRTIAHWMRASRQIMDDVPQLQSIIDGRLRYGLAYVEEIQMLYGDGTGQNLLGIVPQASTYTQQFVVANETPIDRLRQAILQASLALYPPTGIVINPLDWARIEMAKDASNRYLIGNPQGILTPTLWGLPVVSTPAMTVGSYLTGAFRLGAQIFDRLSVEVTLSTEDQDNFVKNMVTIRGEERLALVVYRPQAFITGTLPT